MNDAADAAARVGPDRKDETIVAAGDELVRQARRDLGILEERRNPALDLGGELADAGSRIGEDRRDAVEDLALGVEAEGDVGLELA